MIVCEIIGRTAVRMSGHADLGSKTVCAAVSALANALVESFEAVAGIPDDKIVLSLSEGRMYIDLRENSTAETDVLLGYFETGMLGLARSYPESVRVIRRNNENSKL